MKHSGGGNESRKEKDGNTLQFDTDPGLGLKHSGNTASDKIQLDYEVVSTAPSSVSGTEVGHLWFVV